ncbi:MAG: DoxX family membrane protein [Alphaproteobacteria bacterium]|nr:DoxX family membrane protein [Alphaproteobacteria bacterium]
MKTIENMGFSFFRMTLGAYMLIAGWNKLGGLIATGFDPDKFGLLKSFMGKFHGPDATIAPWLAVFFPKFILIPFTYITPFWEVIAGLLLFIGFYRKYAAVAILLLLLIFGIGTEAANYPKDQNIWMFLNFIGYYLVYRSLLKDTPDPLALENILNKNSK